MIFGHGEQWSDGWENGFKTSKKTATNECILNKYSSQVGVIDQ